MRGLTFQERDALLETLIDSDEVEFGYSEFDEISHGLLARGCVRKVILENEEWEQEALRITELGRIALSLWPINRVD